jgi:hypothetical protein
MSSSSSGSVSGATVAIAGTATSIATSIIDAVASTRPAVPTGRRIAARSTLPPPSVVPWSLHHP